VAARERSTQRCGHRSRAESWLRHRGTFPSASRSNATPRVALFRRSIAFLVCNGRIAHAPRATLDSRFAREDPPMQAAPDTGTPFVGLDRAAARAFAERWRPAWTGNDPERLAGFYSDDALYLDPEVPLGVRGRPAPIAYFRRLLALNPAWVWTQIEGIPLEDGFLNSWRAEVPIGAESMTIVGVCFVQLDASGKIRRNEVYFDRSDWLAAIARQRHARAAGRPSRLHATCARRG
jgi:hypothetical protein